MARNSDRPQDGDGILVTAGDREAGPPGTGTLGMTVFLAALAVLFAASLVGYLVIRIRADTWPPEGTEGLPAGLWVSTVVILGCSAAMHVAVKGIREGNRNRLIAGLAAALVLGVAFLGLQAWNWQQLLERNVSASRDLYGFTFYMLTGLHGLHVIAGLVPLVFVLVRAVLGKYTWASHVGVRQLAMYWHFLDVVWLVLFVVLLLGG